MKIALPGREYNIPLSGSNKEIRYFSYNKGETK
jgi:hypothetical protein